MATAPHLEMKRTLEMEVRSPQPETLAPPVHFFFIVQGCKSTVTEAVCNIEANVLGLGGGEAYTSIARASPTNRSLSLVLV